MRPTGSRGSGCTPVASTNELHHARRVTNLRHVDVTVWNTTILRHLLLGRREIQLALLHVTRFISTRCGDAIRWSCRRSTLDNHHFATLHRRIATPEASVVLHPHTNAAERSNAGIRHFLAHSVSNGNQRRQASITRIGHRSRNTRQHLVHLPLRRFQSLVHRILARSNSVDTRSKRPGPRWVTPRVDDDVSKLGNSEIQGQRSLTSHSLRQRRPHHPQLLLRCIHRGEPECVQTNTRVQLLTAWCQTEVST